MVLSHAFEPEGSIEPVGRPVALQAQHGHPRGAFGFGPLGGMAHHPFAKALTTVLGPDLERVDHGDAVMDGTEASSGGPVRQPPHDGGAGTIEKSKFTADQEQAYRNKLTEAVEAGYKVVLRSL